MRLRYVQISGFRRFFDSVTVRFSERLIALVGRNEAGKSSVLDALHLLNDEQPIPDQDRTRNSEVEARIAATFALDEDDHDSLKDIKVASIIRTCTITKTMSGRLEFETEPPVPHDLGPRTTVLQVLKKAFEMRVVQSSGNASEIQSRQQRINKVISTLESTEDYLGDPAVKSIRALATELWELSGRASTEDKEAPKLQELSERLDELALHEEMCAPKLVKDILLPRRPSFLLFDQASRELDGSYDLKSRTADPPRALRNLAAMAGLDLERLLKAMTNENDALVAQLLTVANHQLAAKFSERWVDRDVVPHLKDKGTVLKVLVQNQRDWGTSGLAERSDGYRWFVALAAFLDSYVTDQKPVLLVDEAETHLSYDAQAHLVTLFETQQLAQQIIYTTHSAGCLPSDLGTGVRPVVPAEDGYSTIRNSFWTIEPGFTPLLLTMGLGAVAFTPSRNVLIGEGASECLLLPTLIRQACESTDLGYQVAPGAANAGKENINGLLAEAGRVAFVFDGDQPGVRSRDNFIAWGVPAEKVTSIDVHCNAPVTLEDLVELDVFVKAYNAELRESCLLDVCITEKDVPSTGRMTALRHWETNNGIGSGVSKAVLCQRLAAMASEDRRIVSDKWVPGLQQLHSWALSVFNDGA